MENNNGKGIFYGVIGVATLIVAIIGATFAYFTATASNAETISGTAATVGLNLEVTKVSEEASGGLVPIKEDDLQKGVTGKGNACVDSNGNTVCQIYKISLTTTGDSTVVVNGTLSLTGGTYANLKWAELQDQNTVSESNPKNPSATTSLVTSKSVSSSLPYTTYVVVYINETEAAQNETDTGSFTGTVSFNAADGSGVTATFSD